MRRKGKTKKGARRLEGRRLPYAPTFASASDAEIRDAYANRVRHITTYLELALEKVCHRLSVGSPEWRVWADTIDRVELAVTSDGWASARRARMLLLAAVDDAVFHAARERTHAAEIGILRAALARDEPPWSDEELQAAALLVTAVPTLDAADAFERATGRAAPDDVPGFAAYMFRLRCPEFAANMTPEALKALRVAVEAWQRTRGRPRAGAPSLTKWAAADALMKCVGLSGSGSETLEKDWRAWQRLRESSALTQRRPAVEQLERVRIADERRRSARGPK